VVAGLAGRMSAGWPVEEIPDADTLYLGFITDD
jgi:hypothetical protein